MLQILNTNLKMTSLEIAELLDARHDSLKRTIERLSGEKVIGQPPMVDDLIETVQGAKRNVKVYVFEGEKGKRDSIIVVAQLKPAITAKIVDRWLELESCLSKPVNSEASIQVAFYALENISNRLQLSNSSYLGCQRKLHKEFGFPTSHLPDYTIDASDKNAMSSDIHHSLSHLLKEHGIKLSAKVVYVALDDKGITCLQSRKSSNGTTKKFRSIVNTRYGVNLVSDRNKYETHPHFFDHNFNELISKIGLR